MTRAFPGFESGLANAPGVPSEPRARERRGDVTLVTGAAGFIGRHVVSQLGSVGGEVMAIGHTWHCRAELETLLGASSVDRCIHLGWYADPTDYLSSETANLVSLRSSIELVGVLMSRGCQHLTVAGTSAEYRPREFALSERDGVEEATPYAQAKATLRDLTAELSRLNVLPTAWCRIFNVAGPGEHPGRLLPLVAARPARGIAPRSDRRDTGTRLSGRPRRRCCARGGVRGPLVRAGQLVLGGGRQVERPDLGSRVTLRSSRAAPFWRPEAPAG